MLRSACLRTVEAGERAAWIDGSGRIFPGSTWNGVLIARPKTEREALGCTEELLRSGGFGLVVRVGEGGRGVERLRLCRAAREGGTAMVELSRDPYLAAVRMQSRVTSGSFRWCRNELGEPVEVEGVSLRIRVETGGWRKESTVVLGVSQHEHTLSLEPSLEDRRGVRR